MAPGVSDHDAAERRFARCDPAQRAFHAGWHHLHDPHVRALAALLSGPDLLDPTDPRWHGRLADPAMLTAGAPGQGADTVPDAWLAALERAPQALHAHLGQRYTRLGLYAEKLLAFYFEQRGVLLAHGLQVRAAKNDTVGEFDFLLRAVDGVRHLELATKFFLQVCEHAGPAHLIKTHFLGPNLADSLALKLGKIFDAQLQLGHHPAAQAVLAQAPLDARALVKGWLFYRLEAGEAGDEAAGRFLDAPLQPGLAPHHARGFWAPLHQCAALLGEGAYGVILPKAQWLAPLWLAPQAAVQSGAQLQALLADHFAQAHAPLQIALLYREDEGWYEWRRGFIVPDDWAQRAQQWLARRA